MAAQLCASDDCGLSPGDTWVYVVHDIVLVVFWGALDSRATDERVRRWGPSDLRMTEPPVVTPTR